MKHESFDSIPEEIFHIFPDENIVLTSKPEKCINFDKGDFLISFVGLFFVVFMIFDGYECLRPHLRGGRHIFGFIFFDLPFMLLGLYMLFLRLILRCKKLLNTVYILTDNKVAAYRMDKKILRFLQLDEIIRVTVERRGRYSTVWFESDSFPPEIVKEDIQGILSVKGVVRFAGFKDVDLLLESLKNLEKFKNSKACRENLFEFN